MHSEWWQEYVTFHQRREICYLDFKYFTIAVSLLFYIILFWIAVVINGNRGKRIVSCTYTDIPEKRVVIFLIKVHLILKCISSENINSLRVCKLVYGLFSQLVNCINTCGLPVLIIHYTSREWVPILSKAEYFRKLIQNI